jgi:hypothetical protein
MVAPCARSLFGDLTKAPQGSSLNAKNQPFRSATPTLLLKLVLRGVSITVLAALALGVGAVSAGTSNHRISQRAVGAATLAASKSKYRRIFGRPLSTTRFANGLTRLMFEDGELAVYLSSKGRGVAVQVSASEYKTAVRVGPCSTVPALRHAYGRRLVAQRRRGQIVAYRLKRLVFVTADQRIGSIMLAKRGFPVTIAVNAGQCGVGEGE